MQELMKKSGTTLGLAAAALFAGNAAGQCGGGGWSSGCSTDDTKVVAASVMSNHDDIVDTAVNAGSFTILAAALEAAGLVHTLKGDGPFTVFAPTDDAFKALPKGTVENLLKPENKKLLQTILTYHVVSGEVMASEVVTRSNATTVSGQRVDISVSEGGVKIDDASVIKTDIKASNGVIHVIDRVIMPSTADIIQTAGEAGSFTTLAAAIKAAGLVEALKSEGPLTVFAPTDEAFGALPRGTVNTLLKPENKHKLIEILTFHVVPGRIYADQAIAAQSAETLQGDRVRIGFNGGALTVNGATVLATDVEASNGVIHVIDSVLLPE